MYLLTAPRETNGWGDVAVIAPWTMYQVYGDKNFLENQYPSMKAWVEYIRKKAGDSYIWKNGSKYGDHLSEPDGYTAHDFIATAFYAYSTSILAEAAKTLGKADDAKMYSELFGKIKEVFINEYVTKAGRGGTNSQTSYVLALKFNLLPDNLCSKAALSAGIEINGPGYKHIIIQPHPTKKLTYSRASFESSYGTIASGWESYYKGKGACKHFSNNYSTGYESGQSYRKRQSIVSEHLSERYKDL